MLSKIESSLSSISKHGFLNLLSLSFLVYFIYSYFLKLNYVLDRDEPAFLLDSLLKHQVKITTSVKDSFGVALASDYTSAGFTTASVCSSACSWIYAGSAELSTESGHAGCVLTRENMYYWRWKRQICF